MSEPKSRSTRSGPAGVANSAGRGGSSGRKRTSRGRAALQPSGAARGTVTIQAREADAAVLGLRSASELVREGLRLVHKQARELAMAASYDEFYGGHPAPVSEVTAALWPE